MSNSRTTSAALLGTVTTLANTVTGAIGTVDTSLGMVTTAINDAARRQAARSKLDAVAYKKVIATEKAMEVELQKEAVIDWCDKVKGRSDRFNATYNELLAVLG